MQRWAQGENMAHPGIRTEHCLSSGGSVFPRGLSLTVFLFPFLCRLSGRDPSASLDGPQQRNSRVPTQTACCRETVSVGKMLTGLAASHCGARAVMVRQGRCLGPAVPAGLAEPCLAWKGTSIEGLPMCGCFSVSHNPSLSFSLFPPVPK